MGTARLVLVIWLGLSFCALPGCMENEAELEKEILAYDSSFKEFIDKRNSFRGDIEAQKEVYQKKEADIEGKIDSSIVKSVEEARND